ncbi:MAG TPA: hypothetical protein VFB16_15250 [Bauldia sp.]|nr:hypothetical protein [Bauldia sp.]
MSRIVLAGMGALLLGAAAPAEAQKGPGVAEIGKGCPTEEIVKATIEAYIKSTWYKPADWKAYSIAAIEDFKYGEIAYGRLQMPGSQSQTCPIRVEFAYAVKKTDGTSAEEKWGAEKTYSFSVNPFDEWSFTY